MTCNVFGGTLDLTQLQLSQNAEASTATVCVHVLLLPTDLRVAGHDFRQSVIRHAVSYARFR